jgi:hypothetical protein
MLIIRGATLVTLALPVFFPDRFPEELSRVIGGRQALVKDRKNLPYTDAVIHCFAKCFATSGKDIIQLYMYIHVYLGNLIAAIPAFQLHASLQFELAFIVHLDLTFVLAICLQCTFTHPT